MTPSIPVPWKFFGLEVIHIARTVLIAYAMVLPIRGTATLQAGLLLSGFVALLWEHRSNLKVAWQEARWGKLWEQGVDGITKYNRLNKVEPMQRALDELDARGWVVGLRRAQASTRRELKVLGIQDGYLKVHPIVDWNDKHVYDYLTRHDLPYHPLWEQGYPSIGDWHTSHKLTDGMTEEETRFFGLKRECGLHESSTESER